MSIQNGKCIIICAGDLTVSEIPVSEGDYVIAADGGYDYCKLLSITPDLVIGDLDSVSEESAEQLQSSSPESDLMKLPCEKDDTDTLAAIKVGLEKGYRSFFIYAATGGRLEHSIANIQCLLYLKEQDATGYLMDGTGLIFAMKNETIAFRESMEGYLSLFSMVEQSKGVSIKGFKYTMENGTISNSFPIGISNEFIGEKGEITVENGTLIGIITY